MTRTVAGHRGYNRKRSASIRYIRVIRVLLTVLRCEHRSNTDSNAGNARNGASIALPSAVFPCCDVPISFPLESSPFPPVQTQGHAATRMKPSATLYGIADTPDQG